MRSGFLESFSPGRDGVRADLGIWLEVTVDMATSTPVLVQVAEI